MVKKLVKKKAPMPWWKDQNANFLDIEKFSGYSRDGFVGGYDKHGINVQAETLRKTETPKTVKIELKGYYTESDKYGDPNDVHITGAKKIIKINSRTTKTQMRKIIKDFHKSAKGKLYRMK